ncbi:hypothetical protein KKD81_02330 [Patescibacteria group bacterium]|nr:hypothetical protein [Patescibacteria group bacterium]MBU2220753.1 hypothetical protein [Patescibacteria group bacterium]
MTTVCFNLCGVVLDIRASLHALACEESGLDIPAATFAGKESVGMKFPLRSNENRLGVFQTRHWEAVKYGFFEHPDDFIAYGKFVPGAIRSAQIFVSHGMQIALVSGVKRLDEGLLREFLRENKFPNTDAGRILTRGAESKVPWQSCCDIVVEDDLGPLKLLAETADRPHLFHFLPARTSVGGECEIETSMDSRIMSGRGFEEAEPYILQFAGVQA